MKKFWLLICLMGLPIYAFSSCKEEWREIKWLTTRAVICSNVTSNIVLNIDPSSIRDALIIENSTIPSIPLGSPISANLNLRYLILRNLSIKQISPGAFNRLQHMTNLDLSFNRLTQIAEGHFNQLQHLKSLYLSGNLIDEIEDNSFSNLRNLEVLLLDHNRIRTLNKFKIGNLLKLSKLDVSGNPLKEIPLEFPSLRILEASYTNLKRFDMEQPYYRPQLKLNISHSHLEMVDFAQFRAAIADFSHNNINSVSNCNKLYVRYLYLSWNHITHLHNVSKNVVFLYLDHNRISNLATTFSSRVAIQTLDLSFNAISEISGDSFSGLENLTTLYLHHNHIKLIPQNAFKKCSNLKYLDLSFNSIEIIEAQVFGGANSLSHFNISYNNLKTLNSAFFSNLNQLTDLFVNDNEIREIDVDSICDGTKLKFVALARNRLSCNGFREVLRKFYIKNIRVVDENEVEDLSCSFSNKG